MNKLFFLIILSLFILGCIPQTVDTPPRLADGISEEEMMKENVIIDEQKMVVTEEIKALMGSTEFDYVVSLKDVADGTSSGTGFTVYTDSKFLLKADTRDLPDPLNTDFYEGWIVRKGIKFNVISTGRLEGGNGIYSNRYASEEDLTDHKFYVITLEPDDGNPAPAEHILEGTLEPIIR